MSYASYAFYTSQFLGTAITEEEFPQLALKASAAIDQMTFGRAELATDNTIINKIRMAMCSVAEKLKKISSQAGGSGGISSETVGSHSVSYVEGSSMTQAVIVQLQDEASAYLVGTDLLYKGFAEGEYSGGDRNYDQLV